MRAATSAFELIEPRSVRHALAVLRDRQPVVPLAGCTDLYVALNAGVSPGVTYLNLWGLEDLRGISAEGRGLRIGALTTYTEILRSPLVRRRLPALAAAAAEIGAVQIQNRGTLGGNIANASPAGDTLPVLAVAEAVLVLRSLDDTRRVPFNGFYTAYRQTVMRPDEIITAIEIPEVPGRQWFRKVGTRAAQAISKIVAAGVRSAPPRLALGSVAPTVVRLPRTEAVLARGGSLQEATDALMGEISPIDDLRSTAAYRRRVAANLLAAFWNETA